MDIVKITEDGAVIEFYGSELYVLADLCRQGCDDRNDVLACEALHACFQALALGRALADGRQSSLTWNEHAAQAEADTQALQTKADTRRRPAAAD